MNHPQLPALGREASEPPQVSPDIKQRQLENATAILRVFNYYRVFLSFALLLLFIQVPDQRFVGHHSPELFQAAILVYIAVNITVSFLSLLIRSDVVARRDVTLGVLTLDVVLLSLLIYASGGISSGLSSFLIFPVAFAGVLAYGRYSVVVPSIAVILGFYTESNLIMRGSELKPESFFEVGILGMTLFAVNTLFQYFAVQLRQKEAEVTTLNRLNEMRRIAEETKAKLDDSTRKFEVLLNSAGDGVLGLNMNGAITFANPKAAELLCIPCQSLIGCNIIRFAFPNEKLIDESNKFQRSGILHRLDVASRQVGSPAEWARGDGDSFISEYSCEATKDSKAQSTGAVVIFQDATKRREMEEKMNYLANYDSLTNLVNRGFFQTTLEQAVSRGLRNKGNLAVLLLDLDHFKYVNDHYGHDYGDELLHQVSERMLMCIRSGDTAARLGGDEFAILLLDFHTADNVSLVARNLIEEIAKPYSINGKQLRISASIGIAALDDTNSCPNDLLKAADTAMYTSKAEGRNTYCFFSPDMQREAESSQRIQIALHNAVEMNEFQIHYQPIVALEDQSIHHSEALIRWNPHGEDPISPDIFIPIAEETGKISEIGNWVLTHVLQQMESWIQHYGVCPGVSINVSTKQLASAQFRQHIEACMNRYGVPPEAIELELTETGIMNDPEFVFAELVALHELGLRISLDDFGTGNSSLEYLRKLPVDQLKIDKCFVQGIGVNRHDEEIIRVITAIALALNLTVVAEGIETEAQNRFLKDAGCHLGQGYLFHRPIDAIAMSKVIDAQIGEQQNSHLSADNRYESSGPEGLALRSDCRI